MGEQFFGAQVQSFQYSSDIIVHQLFFIREELSQI